MKRLPIIYKLLFGVFIILLFASLVIFLRGKKEKNLFLVKEVIDGDTIVLENNHVVRYIGIDAPELKKYSLAQGWIEDPHPFAQAAFELNQELVAGKRVRLEFDVQKKDKFGRWLVYCFVDGIFINAKILEEGFAMLYTRSPNVKYVDLLIKSFRQAKEQNKGLWGQENIISIDKTRDFIGSVAVVEGKVVKARFTRNTIILNFGSGWRPRFTAVIFKKDVPFFVEEGVYPYRDYEGKEVKVFGLIKEYKNRPEIIIRDPSQIEIIKK